MISFVNVVIAEVVVVIVIKIVILLKNFNVSVTKMIYSIIDHI